jgi:hypothetical protein
VFFKKILDKRIVNIIFRNISKYRYIEISNLEKRRCLIAAKEETRSNDGLGFCQSFMAQCCSPGSAEEEKKEKFYFKSCEPMMKQFCAGKDGTFDFDTFRSKAEQFCQKMNIKEKK